MVTQYVYGQTEVQILDTLKLLSQNISTSQSNLVNRISTLDGYVRTGFNSVSDTLEVLLRDFENFMEGIDGTIADAVTGVYESIVDWFTKSINSVSGYIDDLFNGVTDYFDSGYQYLKDFFTDTWDGVKDTYNEYGELFDNTIEGLQTNISDTLLYTGSMLYNTYDNVKDITERIYHNTNKYFDEGVTAIQSALHYTLNDISNYFALFYEDVKAGLMSLTEFNSDDVVNIMSGMLESYQKVYERFSQREL